MRLTILNQFYRPDLAPTAMLAASLAEHRACKGDEVTVIAGKGGYTGGGGAAHDSGPTGNPRVRRVWTPGLGKAKMVKRVFDYMVFHAFAGWRLATLPRQDAIISLTTPPLIAWAATLHKRLHRSTKLILWNMDCYPEVAERCGVMKPGGIAARFFHARNRAVFRRLDHLVCLDMPMAHLVCGNYAGVHPTLPVTIIPNWEDLTFFPRDAAPARWSRAAEYGLDEKFVVLYLGNMGYGHDFQTVLDAAEQLRSQPAVFLFVGGGHRYAPMAAEVKRRGLSHVILRGYVPKAETPAVMAACDAALVTLRDAALGLMSPSKIHSNLAAGLPLVYVGPETSNVDEAVKRFGCGVSLRNGDAEGLVAYVRGLMSDPARLAKQRWAARRAFEVAYCDRSTLPLFDAVIEHALGGRPARVPRGTAVEFGSRAREPAGASKTPTYRSCD